MNKALKELYDNAEPRLAGRYDWFLVVSDNKKYSGFCGENGYNSMTLLGYDSTTQKYYKVTSQMADVFYTIDKMTWNIDIPTKYNCVRIFFNGSVYITDNIPISSVRLSDTKEEDV